MDHKVKLKLVGNGPRIHAPEFCPYGTRDLLEGISVHSIHPSTCGVCKMCTFITCTETEDFNKEDRRKFQEFLTSIDKKLAKSLYGQFQFLRKNDRIALSIYVSDEVFDKMLHYAVNDKSRELQIKSYFLNSESPLCHISGAPVYYSRKLTRSEIQVVGEVAWKA